MRESGGERVSFPCEVNSHRHKAVRLGDCLSIGFK